MYVGTSVRSILRCPGGSVGSGFSHQRGGSSSERKAAGTLEMWSLSFLRALPTGWAPPSPGDTRLPQPTPGRKQRGERRHWALSQGPWSPGSSLELPTSRHQLSHLPSLGRHAGSIPCPPGGSHPDMTTDSLGLQGGSRFPVLWPIVLRGHLRKVHCLESEFGNLSFQPLYLSVLNPVLQPALEYRPSWLQT